MKPDKDFPVTQATTVTLSCNAGYELTGDETVTCTKETKFTFSQEPKCGEQLLSDQILKGMISL